LREELTPLSADSDCTAKTWLANSPYPLWRKRELQEIDDDYWGCITPENVSRLSKGLPTINQYCKLNSFVKDETYPTYKSARSINSRTDQFKVRVGPIFKLIEHELFALPYFIKHTPVDERATEIKRELFQAGSKIIGTDYTSYESVFTKEYMETCEFQLYHYMTQNLPDQDWYQIVTKTLAGRNHCQYRNKFTLVVDATRMSGEMCTSLGNSFSNLMSMLFIAEELKLESVRVRVEGDDGLSTFFGTTPTALDFEEIGLIIKIDEYETLTEGSFCGIIADEDEMINVTDPIRTLLDFGWTSREYVDAGLKKKLQLLRAKSLSLAYQYPGCPILSSLAQYGLRMSKDAHIYMKNMNTWQRDRFSQLYEKHKDNVPFRETGFKTRLLVEKRYGISISDQLNIESYLDNKNDLSPISNQAVMSNCHVDVVDYYSKYAFEFDVSELMNNVDCPIYDNYSQAKRNNIGFTNYEPFETTNKSERGYQATKTYKKAAVGSTEKGPSCAFATTKTTKTA
jgi:hypothetical protein